jgi:8-oxo-dGTP diphosphatase
MTMTAVIHVGAGILVRNGMVLACQRRPDQPHPGKWEFPGGKCEAGETSKDCLRRELREELGIDAQVGAEVWRTEHTYAGRAPVALVFCRVDAWRGEIENRVFAELRWVDVARLHELDFLDADRELIRRLAAGAIRL